MSNESMMSEKIDCLAVALSKAQLIIENVSKDKQAYGYKYADLASCLQAVKKPLADNGLAVSQLMNRDELGNNTLITLLMHESGQWLRSITNIEAVIMKQCNGLQQLGAGLTYVRRYALSAIVGLTQEDDDAMSLGKIKEKEIEINPIKELINLCAKEKVNLKEFTKFHKINSENLDSVTNGITNFNKLKDEFLYRTDCELSFSINKGD